MSPSLADRASALVARVGTFGWLYALVLVPLITDWLENGSLPTSPRGWITEIVGGALIAALVAKVRHDQRMLEGMARTDVLTSLSNRRAFEAAIEIECARARRARHPLTVVYLDIDHFKDINDRFGHSAGDQVLRQVALAIRETIRAHVDSGFRLGGDEFALLLPSTTKQQAEPVLARIRASCASRDSLWAAEGLDFSAGIVELANEEAAVDLLRRSDAAMYLQKGLRRSKKG
jgi:diguanylate cyclase (GGDEF)-like protein